MRSSRPAALIDNHPAFRQKEPRLGSQALRKCVETGLHILGVSAKTSTIYFIELKGGIKLTEMLNKPDEFVNSLRLIFGLGGRELLKSILRELRLEETKSGQDGALHDFADAIERDLDSVEAGIV